MNMISEIKNLFNVTTSRLHKEEQMTSKSEGRHVQKKNGKKHISSIW